MEVDSDTAQKAAEAVRTGWHMGEWIAASAATILAFFGGKRAGLTSKPTEERLVDTFRLEAEATRDVLREEGEASRRALNDGFSKLHNRIDLLTRDVARIDARTEHRGN